MIPFSLFFDLDGTLTDSGEGIINCAQLALRHFGLSCDDRTAMRAFVGPPLRESFPKFGVPEQRVEEAVSVFRSRYTTVGIFENTPYPGVREMLKTLKEYGYPMYIATSKPEPMAHTVLSHFGLEEYFTLICGANLSGTRDTKDQVLRHLLSQLPEGQRALMIGDTRFDVEGARAVGISTLGVTWGYGTAEELHQAGALSLVHTPAELTQTLLCEEMVKNFLA